MQDATRLTRSQAAGTTQAAAMTHAPRTKSKTTASRKPLLNRDNVPQTSVKAKSKSPYVEPDVDREPIKAYLRIRPHTGQQPPVMAPYLNPLSSTTVQISDPSASLRIRSTIASSSTFTFSHVFPPDTPQSEFFQKTTIPLIRDVLEGSNGLIFAYGVTNSGKTYTIQGGSQPGSAGLLPRTLDVVFNSVDGLQSNSQYRPVRKKGIELGDDHSATAHFATEDSILGDLLAEHPHAPDMDTTALKLDRNYEHSIWVSYAEVYNEQIFDLLSNSMQGDGGKPIPKVAAKHSDERGNFARPTVVMRKALALKNDPDGGGKYIAGLREVRVRTAEEAKGILKTGQINRRVFGTLANSESSRSHGVFTIKVMRVHKGSRNDPNSIQTSHLSIVDLAGSERAKNTHSTGERLKEAGNINKSLMVLGQCMEVLRANQRKLGNVLSGIGRADTRDIKPSFVPFRLSKLTELFQDFFAGDGRAVMIVNVNPYDTGYDENSRVMKFSALAREVNTTATKRPAEGSLAGPSVAGDSGLQRHRRKVTISTGGSGRNGNEAVMEVLEEDEEDDVEAVDEPFDREFVDYLCREIEELNVKLYDAEMQCAVTEAQTREEVMAEMEQRMLDMERMYRRRMEAERDQEAMKTDAKIDMLHQSGLFGRRDQEQAANDLEDEASIELDFGGEDDESNHTDPTDSENNSDSVKSSRSSSPLAGRTQKGGRTPGPPGQSPAKIQVVPDGPELFPLPSHFGGSEEPDAELTDDDEFSEAEERVSDEGTSEYVRRTGNETDDDDVDDDDDEDDASNDDDWRPSTEVKSQVQLPKLESVTRAKGAALVKEEPCSPGLPPVWDSSLVSPSKSVGRAIPSMSRSKHVHPKPLAAGTAMPPNRRSTKSSKTMSELKQNMDGLSIIADDEEDENMAPDPKQKRKAGQNLTIVDSGEPVYRRKATGPASTARHVTRSSK